MTHRLAGLWRNPDFMKLWLGQAISELGSHITRDGLPLAAVLTLSATPVQMGILNAIGALPVVVFGLFAGVWADRVRRRPILIFADLGRALVLATIPLAAFLGVLHIGQLYIVAALAGSLTIFFDVAHHSFVPTLVGKPQIVEANSKLETTSALAEIGGSALAGGLVQALTAPVAILFDAISFLFSAICIGSIRASERPHPRPLSHSMGEGRGPSGAPASHGMREEGEEAGVLLSHDAGQRDEPTSLPLSHDAGQRDEPTSLPLSHSMGEGLGVRAEIVAGLRFVLSHPLLRAVAASTAQRAFFGSFFAALYSLYAVRTLGMTPAAVGLLIAAGGVGSLPGAILAGGATRRFGVGRTLIGSALASALLSFLTPLAGGSPAQAVAMMLIPQLIGDFALTIYFVSSLSLRQIIAPAHLLGRVNGSMDFLIGCLAPLGALAGGGLGELIGARSTLLVAVVGNLLAVAWLLASPARSFGTDPKGLGDL